MFTLPRISSGASTGAALICLAALAGGCAANEYPGYGYDDEPYVEEPGYVVYEEAYPGGYVYEPGGYYYGPAPYTYYDGGGYWYGGHYYRGWRDDHRVIRNRLPRDASVVAQGRGAQTYQADRDGRVYVRDAKSGKLLYRGRLEAGEKFTLDPSRHRATVDGNVVRREITRQGHENQIYFDPRGDNGRRSASVAGGGDSRRSDSGPRAAPAARSDGGGSRSDGGGRSHGGDGGGGSGDRRR